MIQCKDREISLSSLKRHTGELFPFICPTMCAPSKGSSNTELFQDIINDKPNSVAMFLRIQTASTGPTPNTG